MPLNRLGDYLSQTLWNQNVDKQEALTNNCVGRGVVSGVALSAGSGLVLNVGAGVVVGDGAALNVASQTYTVPASGTYQIQIDTSTNTISHQATLSDPGGTIVVLGRVVTGTSTITSVNETGRRFVMRSTAPGVYKFGDDQIVIDPSVGIEVAGEMRSQTALVEGTAQLQGTVTFSQHVALPVNTETISADKTLTVTSPNVQVLTASGANRKVILPASPGWGSNFRIINAGASNSLLVRNPADTTTITTIAPGEGYEYYPASPSGGGSSPEWRDVRALDGSIGAGE